MFVEQETIRKKETTYNQKQIIVSFIVHFQYYIIKLKTAHLICMIIALFYWCKVPEDGDFSETCRLELTLKFDLHVSVHLVKFSYNTTNYMH